MTLARTTNCRLISGYAAPVFFVLVFVRLNIYISGEIARHECKVQRTLAWPHFNGREIQRRRPIRCAMSATFSTDDDANAAVVPPAASA